jgi:FKBP-type peptidyl-prolyl cis-trans isomerase FkpA
MKQINTKYWHINIYIILSVLGCILISGCFRAPPPEQKMRSASISGDSLINRNKRAIEYEDQQIRQYISRMGWQMLETGTGLRYTIIEKGNGPKANPGNLAHIDYELRLITGELCYSSQKTGPKEFRIGSGGVVSGLEEGILLLHKGDRAKFILPSHLAFGLLGDQDKIPGRCTIIYDVHLFDLN